MSGIALCYVRKSSVRTASDEISPARQRAAISQEAERRGWTAEIFADAEGHRSGRNENRPAWIQLKSRLADPLIKAVVVESLSRASRSTRDLFVFIGELEKRKIEFVSLKENIDTTTAMGRAFFGIIAVLNQFESDVASERMRMTVAFKRDTLRQHWGYAPFGCVRQGTTDSKLVPSREGIWRIHQHVVIGAPDNPPFADTTPARFFGYADAVRACLELYAANEQGLIKIAIRLNEQGYLYRDRNGMPRPFHTDDVRRMVDNVHFYAGNIPRRKSKDTPAFVVENTHSPILPYELCERVAAVHESRRPYWATGNRHAKRIYLLPQLYCAECGAHLKGQYSHGVRYYRHSEQEAKPCTQTHYIHADILESAALDCLDCFKATDAMKARIREKARRLAKQTATPEVETARRRLKENASKLERLKILFVEGEIDRAEYQRRKAKIETQQQEATRILQTAPPDVRMLENVLPKLEHLATLIRDGEPKHQRAALSALFERIEILDCKISKVIPHEWARPLVDTEQKQA